MNKCFALFLAVTFSVGCSTTQVYSNAPAGVMPGTNASGQVAILYSYPSRPYEVIGIVSAKRYKPGWTDPTVSDAIPQLRAAGAGLGADAVVVRSSRSNNDRHTVVEAEAIRYTDAAPAPQRRTIPAGDSNQLERDPAKRCDACSNIRP